MKTPRPAPVSEQIPAPVSEQIPAPTANQAREYVLPITHEHEGRQYPAGHTLTLYPDQIALIESVAAQLSQSAQ